MASGRHNLVLAILLVSAGPAAAQTPWPGEAGAHAPAKPTWPDQRPGDVAPTPPMQFLPQFFPAPEERLRQVCMTESAKLHEEAVVQVEVMKKRLAARAAGKVPGEEWCELFTSYAAAEGTWVRFVEEIEENVPACSAPAGIATWLKKRLACIEQIRQQFCTGRPAPHDCVVLHDELQRGGWRE